MLIKIRSEICRCVSTFIHNQQHFSRGRGLCMLTYLEAKVSGGLVAVTVTGTKNCLLTKLYLQKLTRIFGIVSGTYLDISLYQVILDCHRYILLIK